MNERDTLVSAIARHVEKFGLPDLIKVSPNYWRHVLDTCHVTDLSDPGRPGPQAFQGIRVETDPAVDEFALS